MSEHRRRAAGRESVWGPVQVWLCVFLTAYPLLVGTAGFSGISAFKTILLYVLTGLLALCAAVQGIVWLVRRIRTGRALRFALPRPASFAALGFGLFTLISAAASPFGGRAWYDEAAHEGAVSVCCYVLIFLAVSRWATPNRAILGCFAAMSAVFGLICVLQLLSLNPLGLYPAGGTFYDGSVKYHGRFLGTVGNVDLVSAFCSLCIPILGVIALCHRGWGRYPAAAAGLCCVVILIKIRVLCGIVGLVVGGWICLLVLLPVKRRVRLWLLLATAVLVLNGTVLLWFFDRPSGLIHELHEILHGRFNDSFGTGRFFIWRQILSRVPGSLWLGVGPDMTRYTGLEEFRRVAGNGRLITAMITDAHCLPLQILYCQGLPALLHWLAAVGLSLRAWFRKDRSVPAAALGAGLICFLISMLFCFSSVILSPLFWAALGLLNAADRRRGSGSETALKAKQ